MDPDERHILVVEDNQANAALLAAYLGRAGYRVETADSGEAALAHLAESSIDLLIVDGRMPGMDGYQLLRTIRDGAATPPVIMLTAFDDAGDRERAVNLGVDDFLTKPVSKLLLLQRVEALLEVAALPGGLERTLAYCAALERRTH
ncbi:MAG: two-component system response regulator [Nitrospirae bacterium CG18_big_fil_WC_8_21_14_2_50_70_55]|nr:response regulator [Deltaproteobacteria bacterium]OIP63941.1 MAG: hypothetical protein AUK30_07580 [Nitrospirae bacterium CG2_30_70_394]PIQ05379.1 MAG: two-component system response regulator [Nitrospirae bacterium CG18_big_fil_WC_8_21_14_2_50_70_55]PIU80058.1 MAG: two-component system response regulator [Nitrospirae bacterium CG06_land_8_20_14_3_00_70_43]PIW83500.1 MAG: two-component system response regulator [Nitrospirae bacterium CG_4_8_14_3_um_filter_70_85]PIX83521.1 MAG: two-component 